MDKIILKTILEQHLEWLKRGASFEDQTGRAILKKADLRGADLIKADLSGAYLTGADLSRADLSRADLSGADLSHAKLSGARLGLARLSVVDLSGARLSGARLSGADLSHAKLSGADLSYAKLQSVRFMQTTFHKADISESQLESTSFLECELVDIKGLDTCRHLGPSYLDMKTLQMSGPLPHVFLQGCGLSDQQIDYLNTLHTQPIQFYSCFISYSTKDKDFANRLYVDLQREGVRCWFAPEDIQAGKKLYEQIDKAIRHHEKLLLVLSKESMNSEWVKTEITKARQREVREGCRVLFPVSIVDFEAIKQWECFDGDTGKDSAREIREYYIPDFSNWINHNDYRREFDRLLRDLKQEHELKVV
ncbi:MAG: toll/interleukin-1 receptor domain-containing protein [Candidatus Thiodiazotropha endolucinida]|uniref:Toll/interleukin-1 receptor domain-containing protein n=1 Tax=Candidatus Thiodiazotropha taylori TaxID=2792791 RepID=A0A9E4NIL8_9GAMM|nr:toll/interleukin-1 receptor domain-containing protein [Candidatus Thiodiazotropha taylori]MCW4235561.1 toll/interleukin-1 receptor domain-containing protein [Candidatus Thiodiazotropha endolucinida]